jgi:hypothetical protein
MSYEQQVKKEKVHSWLLIAHGWLLFRTVHQFL